MNTDQIAELFLAVITTQTFESFYKNEFEDFVTGEDDRRAKSQIIDKLKKFISQNSK